MHHEIAIRCVLAGSLIVEAAHSKARNATVAQQAREVSPLVDHHKHLLSPAAAEFMRGQRVARGAGRLEALSAEQLIAELDSAGIQKGVVLSVAYWYGMPQRDPPIDDEYAKVRAENDYVAGQVARYPDRLIGFCSFNPLREYALAELDRCARRQRLRGVKLHFANSGVDLRDTTHVETMRRVFRAANVRRLPIVAHLWVVRDDYGRQDAEIFLNRLLGEAPNIPVQIAHFAGGGPGYTDDALEVYADAISDGDPRTRNVYFDVTTVAERQSEATLRRFAMRIRQIGVSRVLFGSDVARPGGNPSARAAWANFRANVPLTEEEFRAIAANAAPYAR